VHSRIRAFSGDFSSVSTHAIGALDAVYAVPAEACSALTNSGDSNVTGKIVIIYRGTCNFDTKALSAQDAGAAAVIIVNYYVCEAGAYTRPLFSST
jgi:hypothetical protein